MIEPSERTGFLILRVSTKKFDPSVLEVSVLFENRSINSINHTKEDRVDGLRLDPDLAIKPDPRGCGQLELQRRVRSLEPRLLVPLLEVAAEVNPLREGVGLLRTETRIKLSHENKCLF